MHGREHGKWRERECRVSRAIFKAFATAFSPINVINYTHIYSHSHVGVGVGVAKKEILNMHYRFMIISRFSRNVRSKEMVQTLLFSAVPEYHLPPIRSNNTCSCITCTLATRRPRWASIGPTHPSLSSKRRRSVTPPVPSLRAGCIWLCSSCCIRCSM